jgi:voltage-gated potassium channel
MGTARSGAVRRNPTDNPYMISERRPPPIRARATAFRLLERSDGTDDASHVVDSLLVLLIMLNVTAVLLESIDVVAIAYGPLLRNFEYFSVTVFSVEYLLRVWACVEDPDSPADRSTIAVRLHYVFSPLAVIDLLAVLPFLLAMSGVLGPADMRVLRVLRLLRLFKLSRYSDAIMLLWRVLRENAANFAAAIGVLLVVMVLAASGMYLIERDAQPDVFGSIPSAMWWAFVTLTTVGYGDVTPVTPLGKLFGAGITLVSIGIVALPAGLLASSFSARLRQNTATYRSAADDALADGRITDEERRFLDRRRRELGIGTDLATEILHEEAQRHEYTGVCPSCGQRVDAARSRTQGRTALTR